MTNFFIGVDGGGSKCKIRVEDANGQLLGQAVSGPANIHLSIDAAWRAIYESLESVFKPLGIPLAHSSDHQFHVCLGLAGCEIATAKEAFLNHPHPFTSLHLTTDAHIACVGAHHGKEGAIIIVGTGVVGYQIQNEQSIKVGGWGFPHDDEGGGAWLGLAAVNLTFQWLDHRCEKSPLVEDIFAYFNHDLDTFVVFANRATSTEYARLAPIVINHAQQEETVAVRLLKKAAHAVDKLGLALIKQQTKPLSCCLMGGIAPFLEPFLNPELQSTFVARKDGPSVGAILLMRDLLKKKLLTC
jgi:glucosamine kinase